MLRTVSVAIALLVSCSTERPIHVPPQTNFEALRSTAREVPPPFPNRGHWLIEACCPKKVQLEPYPEAAAACRELTRLIETAPSYELFDGWGPTCYQVISKQSLLRAITTDSSAASWAISVLDGSAATTSLLFEELAKREPPLDGETLDASTKDLLETLALVGDDEVPVLERELKGEDRRRRHWAVYALLVAAEAPLAPARATQELARLAEAPDLLGTRASAAVRRWRDRPDVETEALRLLDRPRESVIQLLARRRSFCSSTSATTILATFARDPDLALAYLARKAIAERHHRCGADGSSRR